MFEFVKYSEIIGALSVEQIKSYILYNELCKKRYIYVRLFNERAVLVVHVYHGQQV